MTKQQNSVFLSKFCSVEIEIQKLLCLIQKRRRADEKNTFAVERFKEKPH
jgi:hypothetical protein